MRTQEIDNDYGGVGGGRQARGLSNDNVGIDVGRGIYDASKESYTTAEAERIWGQQRRLQRCDDGPKELATTTEALAEEDEPEVSMTKTEASIKDSEDTMRPSERLQRWSCRCVYGLRVLAIKRQHWQSNTAPQNQQ